MATLSERLNALVEKLYNPTDADAALRENIDEMAHIADELEQVERITGPLEETNGEIPTPAQGLALARFLRPQFRDDVHPGDRGAHVTRGGAGLPDDYLYVRFPNSAWGITEGGIDREGRVST